MTVIKKSDQIRVTKSNDSGHHEMHKNWIVVAAKKNKSDHHKIKVTAEIQGDSQKIRVAVNETAKK